MLSFAVIMLHTDLHNPGVKRKMTLEDFVKMNRDVNDGGEFPFEFLREIYEDI